MADIEHILLHTGLPPEETAQRLAEVLDAAVTHHDDGEVSVRRSLAPQAGVGSIGGLVGPNEYGEEQPAAGEESIYDGYDTVYEIWSTIPGEELQHTEAQRIFTDITTRLPWPAAHTRLSGLLYSAYNPKTARADFPEGTSYAAEDRRLWDPYAKPEHSTR